MKLNLFPVATALCALSLSCVALADGAAPSAAPAAALPATPVFKDFPLSKAPYLAAYRWGAANKSGGAKANEVFAQWIKQPVVWAEDFEAIDAWENNIDGGNWQLPEWSAWKQAVPGRRLILSVPLLPGGWDGSGAKRGPGASQKVSLAAGARGEYNVYFKNLAEKLVRNKLDDSVLRLGWEFNGGWYTWRAGADPAGYAGYFAEIVKTMRAVPGAEKLQFCWNPAWGWQQFPSEKAWPGDEYVDYVGLDVYDECWAQNTYPFPQDAKPEEIQQRRERVWNELYNGNHGIKFWRDFAVQHGKPFSIPEWGVSNRKDSHGGLDNPYFVEKMHAFLTDPANKVAFHCYFDVQAGDGHHQLSGGISGTEPLEFPNASAKFIELFGGKADVAAVAGKG